MFGSMFGGGSDLGERVNTPVDFPLEGLDLGKHIISDPSIMSPNGESMIYDCYAVSNHMGGTGGGHYTAYAKNPITDKWHEFDDSGVAEIDDSRARQEVVSSSAYNLFYRRRDWHAKNMQDGIDFEQIALKPDMSYLQSGQE